MAHKGKGSYDGGNITHSQTPKVKDVTKSTTASGAVPGKNQKDISKSRGY